MDRDPGGHRRRRLPEARGHVVRKVRDLPPVAHEEGDHHRLHPVARDDGRAVLEALRHPGDVAHPDHLLPPERDGDLGHVGGAAQLVGAEELVLEVVPLEEPDAADLVRLPDAAGQLRKGDARGGEPAGIGFDEDPPLLGALGGHEEDVGEPGEPGAELGSGPPEEIGGALHRHRGAGRIQDHVEGEHGEDRRRLLLHRQRDPLGEARERRGEARPRLGERVPHVRARGEVEGHLAGAANRLGLDPPEARDRGRGLLQGAGDAHEHVLDGVLAALGDDLDPGEGDVRVDPGGHGRDAEGSRRAEPEDRHRDGPHVAEREAGDPSPVPGGPGAHFGDSSRTFAPSGRP